MDAQGADLSRHWSQMPACTFCKMTAHLCSVTRIIGPNNTLFNPFTALHRAMLGVNTASYTP